MYNQMGNLTRLKYVIIAILLFFVGFGIAAHLLSDVHIAFRAGSLGMGGDIPLPGGSEKALCGLRRNAAAWIVI